MKLALGNENPSLQYKLLSFSSLLFCFGIFTCTWDRILQIELFHFTLKIQQAFFGFSFLGTLIALKSHSISILKKESRNLFFLGSLALFLFYFLFTFRSYYPLKSGFYSIWYLFSLLTIWLNAKLLGDHLTRRKIILTLATALVFHSTVLLIDHIAYSFGYIDGIIGHNQDSLLKWGASRPSAFAYEPSYLSVFFTLSTLFLIPLVDRKQLFKWLPVLILSFCCLLILASRTGILSSVFGLGLYLFMGSKMELRKNLFRYGLAALVFGIAMYFLLTPKHQLDKLQSNLVSTLISGKDGSGNARLRAHLKAWQIAKESNFVGVGLGASYKYWVDNHEKDSGIPFAESHRGNEVIMSIWGQLLAEGGILAIFFYAIAGFSIITINFQNWRKRLDHYYLSSFVCSTVFFVFVCFWIGNICRGDVWVWLALWSIQPKSLEDPT